jgi:hypothetical protein
MFSAGADLTISLRALAKMQLKRNAPLYSRQAIVVGHPIKGWTMKFAAIADVHGNRVALEAVLADIAAFGITDVVNLGDHVSGPLEARRTADLLIERGFPSIRGDQDRRLVEIEPDTGASNRADYKLRPARTLNVADEIGDDFDLVDLVIRNFQTGKLIFY